MNEIEKNKEDALQTIAKANLNQTTTTNTADTSKEEMEQEIREQVQKAKTDITELTERA
jgi:folate-dependent phosphoribosylglycinamide formyltransferase PurN